MLFNIDTAHLEGPIRYSEWRYHNDANFHLIVDQSIAASVPNTINESINDAMREAARAAVCLALVLREGAI